MRHRDVSISWQRKHFDRWTLIRYYQALEETYPEAEVIFVAQDNWPVHFHDEVLHLHDFADCWDKLKVEVGSWLGQFADGSTELLRYVGLCPG